MREEERERESMKPGKSGEIFLIDCLLSFPRKLI